MDKISVKARSSNMAKIKSKDTKPEIKLRKVLFSLGYRYRINYKINKIKVDIAFPSKKKVIYVNGCFWHQHEYCKEASQPKTNSKYWKEKFEKNKERDHRNYDTLANDDWELLVVWECELEHNRDKIVKDCINFLDDD